MGLDLDTIIAIIGAIITGYGLYYAIKNGEELKILYNQIKDFCMETAGKFIYIGFLLLITLLFGYIFSFLQYLITSVFIIIVFLIVFLCYLFYRYNKKIERQNLIVSEISILLLILHDSLVFYKNLLEKSDSFSKLLYSDGLKTLFKDMDIINQKIPNLIPFEQELFIKIKIYLHIITRQMILSQNWKNEDVTIRNLEQMIKLYDSILTDINKKYPLININNMVNMDYFSPL